MTYIIVEFLAALLWVLCAFVLPGALIGWLILHIGSCIYRRRS